MLHKISTHVKQKYFNSSLVNVLSYNPAEDTVNVMIKN